MNLLQIRFLVWFLALTGVPLAVFGQSTLSANSGINSTDTWITLDMTIQASNDSITLSRQMYNPITKTSSNVVTVNAPSHTYHMEAGYDSSGGLVLNLWPTGNPVNPYSPGSVSLIRVAGAQVTVFDQNGRPLSASMPPNAGIPANWPFNLFGSNPAPSLLSGFVVPDIQSRATALKASLTLAYNPSTATLVAPLPKGGGTATWTYALSGSNWIAQQLTVPITAANVAGSRSIQFANINWNDNPSNDAIRGARGSTAGPLTLNTATPPTPGMPSADPAFSPGPSVIPSANCGSTNAYSLGGSQNIVLQHGIWADGCSWTRMANWLNQDFLIGNEIIPSLSSFSALDSSQGTALINEISSVGGNNYILLGHSQGGLVSRYTAQYFQGTQLSPVGGVVTVDTPHQGANLTLNAPDAVAGLLEYFGASMWYNCTGGPDCWLGDVLYSAGVAIEPTLYAGVGSISWSQLQPGSVFLTGLNTQTENFKQAAVVGFTDQNFAFMRIAGNFIWKCNPEDDWCGERDIAAIATYTYDSLLAAETMSEIISQYFYSVGDDDDGDLWSWYAGIFYNMASIMDDANAYYNEFIDYPDGTIYAGNSDAIVQSSSQFYPYPSAVQYAIVNADSHTGALKSDLVHKQLHGALVSTLFNVPTPGTCSFSVSGSPDSVSSGVATGSFTVSTGTGCQWSAVSQTPWITVTSGVNGTSSGTVSFSVDANPSSTPRQGAIEVGNGGATTSFTVDQAGIACTYSLSPPSEVAVSNAGGNGTVQVNTEQDCTWMATSNASWITIPSNQASGTGSGSFPWTAAANTGSDRSGDITVMGQTLTLVEGSPVGTPGTGTVTIQGRANAYCDYYWWWDGSEYLMMPNCNWGKVGESGDVTVTVGSLTFTSSYGCWYGWFHYWNCDSAGDIAGELASQMNYSGSLVSATANGGTITITSSINGASTNYPLNVSFTYNNDGCYIDPNNVYFCNFNAPAFTGIASGAQLTGGTD